MADPVPPVDLASLAAGGNHPGARWRLDGEDLQANLIRLDRGDRIAPHRNDEVEVLVGSSQAGASWPWTARSTSWPRWSSLTCQGDGQSDRGGR